LYICQEKIFNFFVVDNFLQTVKKVKIAENPLKSRVLRDNIKAKITIVKKISTTQYMVLWITEKLFF